MNHIIPYRYIFLAILMLLLTSGCDPQRSESAVIAVTPAIATGGSNRSAPTMLAPIPSSPVAQVNAGELDDNAG